MNHIKHTQLDNTSVITVDVKIGFNTNKSCELTEVLHQIVFQKLREQKIEVKPGQHVLRLSVLVHGADT